MKKIYLLVAFVSAGLIISCGGETNKTEKDKSENNTDEEEEVVEEEVAPVDYSYVLPSIDTSALNSETEILAAMEKVVLARKLDDSLSDAVPEYDGYYTELTNLYSVVSSKASSFAMTLKGKDAMAFSEKLFAVTNKMYE